MSGREVIVKLLQRYMLVRWFEATLLAVSAFMIIFGILTRLMSVRVSFVAGVLGALIVGGIYAMRLKLTKLGLRQVSNWLDHQFVEFEDSTDLLVRDPEEFSSLEKLQLQKVEQRVLATQQYLKLPHRLPVVATVFLLAAATLVILLFWQKSESPPPSAGLAAGSELSSKQLSSAKVTVAPPSYSGLPKRQQSGLDLTALTGSSVRWQLSFDELPERVLWKSADGNARPFRLESGEFTLQMKVTESSIYQIVWSTSADTTTSAYFQLTVQEDLPPVVEVNDIPQFSRYAWGEKDEVSIAATLADDYGLTAATIVATVSKGSGESVKFREERMKFDAPEVMAGKRVIGKKTFHLNTLGMEPGDELYYYVEAADNRSPDPQFSRTPTYFIALQDTADVSYALDDGLGVDIMPDYFRSQRQLIIDTEKLLAEQKKISKNAFNQTSNELGYDQKVLRLRYGQFLGEEFATDVGPSGQGGDDVDANDAESLVQEFGHQHDTENEHHQVEEEKSENPQAEFGHSHDNTDEATFFTQAIKAKLKAALNLMWDSELQLRLYKPKESLPYQYQILKLLKEISQDSRIYVHRMGFDPPPIKEDKRLTGELKDIQDLERSLTHNPEDPYPAIRAALRKLNNFKESPTLDGATRKALQQAGQELASRAVAEPGKYLRVLSLIRDVLNDELKGERLSETLSAIKITLADAVPKEPLAATSRVGMRHATDEALVKELTVQHHE